MPPRVALAICKITYYWKKLKNDVLLIILSLMLCVGCKHARPSSRYQAEHITRIQTGRTSAAELVYFACSLAGKPYKYGSADEKHGFDCSGFVTYVFDHFHIQVPRTTLDFIAVQQEIPLKDAKLGDLVLFTGSDSTERIAGHIGIISSLPSEPLRFMHAGSGKRSGVMETDFNTAYYETRYLKTIRIFPAQRSVIK